MLRGARAVAKEAALRILGSGPAVRLKLRAIAGSSALTILNLHRVAPDDASSYPPLDPHLFDRLLGFVAGHFRIVTFGELGRVDPDGRPLLILSFDDAYVDFVEHAAPIMARHGVRANLNVIPACVDSGMPPLNVVVQDFVGKAPRETLASLQVPGFAFDARREPRLSLGNRLSRFLKNKRIAEQDRLAGDLLPRMRAWTGFQPTRMMNAAQVRDVAAVHEIGAHSYAHASLAYESGEYLENDIARCRSWMAEIVDRPLDIYAVPNGSYRPPHIRMLREAGVRHILLVDEDFSSADGDVHRRFTFDAHSLHEMRFRATGGFRWPVRAPRAA